MDPVPVSHTQTLLLIPSSVCSSPAFRFSPHRFASSQTGAQTARENRRTEIKILSAPLSSTHVRGIRKEEEEDEEWRGVFSGLFSSSASVVTVTCPVNGILRCEVGGTINPSERTAPCSYYRAPARGS